MSEKIKTLKIPAISFLFFSSLIFYSCDNLASAFLYPKISVSYNSSEIKIGRTIEFKSYLGNPMEITFIIENMGSEDLIIKGVSSSSSAFTVTKGPMRVIKSNTRTYFIIEFFSKEKSNFSEITILCNDPDLPDFTFNINCRKSNIELYFSGPTYDSLMEDAFIEKVNNQNICSYLDLCFYGMDSENAISAIENAIARGVHVRFVGDLDGDDPLGEGKGLYYAWYYRIADALDLHFPIDGKKRTLFPGDNGFDDFNLINNNIMHNKIALFTENTGNEYLFTGSANCTETDFKLNNNNALIIEDTDIVQTYREQFEYLLGLPGRVQVSEVRHHYVDGIPIEVLFSPLVAGGQNPINYLMETVNSVKNNIYFMIFSFTHFDLINQLIDKFKNGIAIKGVFDESQLSNSSEEFLVQNQIACKIDGNYFEQEDGHGGKLHHKTMIVDESIVITGSFNWSYNANLNNDENIIILYSQEIAKLYKNEWQKRWDESKEIQYVNYGNNENYEYQDIILNELMWMGSRTLLDETVSNDEFIELRNMKDREINLNGWSIEGARPSSKILYLENCSIAPYGYLLIMHKDKPMSAFQPDKYFVTSNLSIPNDSLQIVLKDPTGNIIDYAGNGSAGEDFAGYSDILKKSMARKNAIGEGRETDNWFTSNTQLNISTEYSYRLFNLATPGVDNYRGDIGYTAISTVISEIAWAGTDLSANNEWFELYNNTDADINLAGWSIYARTDENSEWSIQIQLYGIIPAHKHFLLERTDDTTVPDKLADILFTGSLNNNGAIIKLLYNDREIDFIDMQHGNGGWGAGSSNPARISMERVEVSLPSISGNWRDGLGDIEGAETSADF